MDRLSYQNGTPVASPAELDPEPLTGLELTTRELRAVIDGYKRELTTLRCENARLRSRLDQFQWMGMR